ncbi:MULTISPECIES: hypothetical protein [unclassified Hahella]|uniref:hypothetical protein n=1 Tax=unclassified Hahella TaxID=2624107 RepID=UPI001C1F13FA|nr:MULTISPECIES: hypothetical protein [unclassified Hahella]MBU6954650.1 hypothetical protein [Hahella sp. HN01]MDG9666970.1 hypothetical protein [Hahella sp. CR1]
MEEVYKTPESSLIDGRNSRKPVGDYRLYKLPAVGLATFFGTILAGGIILSYNFKQLGREDMARNALVFSLLALVVIFGLAFFVPDIPGVNVVFTVVQLVAMMQIAKKYQGDDVEHHMANGGAMISNWAAFGISLLVLVVVIGLLFGVGMLLPY